MSITNPMSLGEFIRAVYMDPENNSMTMQQIANACGTTQATISKLINGKQELTVDLACKLEKGLGRSAQSWMNVWIAHKIDEAFKSGKTKYEPK